MSDIFKGRFDNWSLLPREHELTPVESYLPRARSVDSDFFWSDLFDLNQSINLISARLRWILKQLKVYKITKPKYDLSDILLLMDHF